MSQNNDSDDATHIGVGSVGGSRAAAESSLAPQGMYAGRYRIERMVGRGGMGSVYRAFDVLVGDVVALKILDGTVTLGGDQLEWFRREVRLARRISHPNVARTHDMGEQSGAHYITMEFVEGTTLQDLLRVGEDRRRQLAQAQAATIAVAVAEGLAAAHAAGVVHRDLKPANVLVEREGRVVLTDFGIARALGDEGGARTQGVVGTPLYMAPEQLSGKPVDARADVYALGLMLFEMLTGTLPFVGDNPIAVAMARLTQAPPDPRTVRADLDPPLAELVLQCMSQKPDGRPASASAVSERLRGWLAGRGEATTRTGEAVVAVAGAGPGPATSATIGSAQTPAAPQSTARTGMPVAFGMALPAVERALAVLPFRYVGRPEQSYLGDALADELIDVLSRTRGLRVLGSGAAAKYRDNRDPRTVGGDLRVDAVIDATVQVSATQLRVTVRLVEVATGTQLWSDKFESGLEDLFALQDRISKRIAEALRVELGSSPGLTGAPAEAVALYLRARRKLTAFQVVGPDSALDLIEQCLALAPDMRPALAVHALVCMRAWFLPSSAVEAPRDWAAQARTSVVRALEVAPDLAETYLARAQLAVQLGEWPEAVQALVKALDIAPTYAQAHYYLAFLQCEAGNTREGIERAQLANDLDPTILSALFDITRVHALHGDREQAQRFIASHEGTARLSGPIRQLKARLAVWFGDRATLEEIAAVVPEETDQLGIFLANYSRAALGGLSREGVDELIQEILRRAPSPRFLSMMCQMCTEIHAARGEPEAALECFIRAADGVLIDIEWTDRCPVLKPMRALPGFAEARRKVTRRVQTMWRV